MKEYKGDFVAIGLDCKGAKQNFLDTSTNVARMTSFHIDQLPPEDTKSWTRKQWDAMSTFLEENRQNIFYLFMFYVVTIALFVERFIRKCTIKPDRFQVDRNVERNVEQTLNVFCHSSSTELPICFTLTGNL